MSALLLYFLSYTFFRSISNGLDRLSGTSFSMDSEGLAASFAGAMKTFSGLQISTSSTTSPTTPTTPTEPSVTKPVLSVADNSLWVAGRGGHDIR